MTRLESGKKIQILNSVIVHLHNSLSFLFEKAFSKKEEAFRFGSLPTTKVLKLILVLMKRWQQMIFFQRGAPVSEAIPCKFVNSAAAKAWA